MAGTPKKRARKMGLPIPNSGDKPPSGKPAMYPRARARRWAPADLPSDAELARIAKARLLDVMADGEHRDVTAACRAMLEATRQTSKAPNDLEAVSDEELQILAAQASATLERTTQ